MATSVTIPDDLARQLQPYAAEIPEILQLGIREWQARAEGEYCGASEVLETLAALPSPEEVLALRPSPQVQRRLDELLEKNRSVGLSAEDQREWNQFRFIEHLVRLAKINATRKLQQRSDQ